MEIELPTRHLISCHPFSHLKIWLECLWLAAPMLALGNPSENVARLPLWDHSLVWELSFLLRYLAYPEIYYFLSLQGSQDGIISTQNLSMSRYFSVMSGPLVMVAPSFFSSLDFCTSPSSHAKLQIHWTLSFS